MPHREHRTERYVKYALIAAIVALVVLLAFVVGQYDALRTHHILSVHNLYERLLSEHAPLAPSDAANIRSWMTFDYINQIFLLPPAYLKTNLDITDAAYPHLTISEYAESRHIDPTTFLNDVENAIRAYFSPANSTSTPKSHSSGGAGGAKTI